MTFIAREVACDETSVNIVSFHAAEWLRSNKLEIVEL